MKHNVILYAVVTVKVEGIKADSHEAAIDAAEKAVDLNKLLTNMTPRHGATYTEFADEVIEYVVDEEGDGEYIRSRRYKWDGYRLVPLVEPVSS